MRGASVIPRPAYRVLNARPTTTRPCWVSTLSACVENQGDVVRIVRYERPRTPGVSTFNGGRVCFIAYRRNFSGYETQTRENPLLYDENVISANAPTSEISLLNARVLVRLVLIIIRYR